MKIKYISKLKNNLKLEIEPTLVNNMTGYPELAKFQDTVDLLSIDNYNETLFNSISKDSLKGVDISNINNGDFLMIENVECKVIILFDGYIRLEAPETPRKEDIKCDYDEDDLPF